MKSNTLASTLCWLSAIAIAFFCGWYGHQRSDGDQQAPVDVTGAQTPDRSALAAVINKAVDGRTWITAKNTQGKVAMAATTGAGSETIESLTIYADQKPVMDAIYHPGGSVKELHVRVGTKPAYSSGFYESGQVEFTAEFQKSDIPGSSTIMEIRQYFDKNGNPTTKRRIGKTPT